MIAASVLTILSLALPFTLPNAPGSMILTLLVMHLVFCIESSLTMSRVLERCSHALVARGAP